MSHWMPRPLALSLGLVLLGHWSGLSWLRTQLPSFAPLAPMREPLFTRIVTPLEPAHALRAAAPTQRHPPSRRRAAAPSLPASTAIPVETAALAPAPADQTISAPPAEPPANDDLPTKPPAPDQPAPETQALETGTAETGDAPPAADRWPANTRLSYRLKGYYRGDMYGSGRVQWQREHTRYQVQVDLRMALLVRVSLTSQGEVTDSGLLPDAYAEHAPWGERRVAFKNGYVTFHNGTQSLQPQALQDTASQFVELSHRFATGRDVLRVGGQVQVWLARPQGMALWIYDVVEEATLDSPEFGPVRAFHLRPRPIANSHGAITAELWFAPSLQYLPVRVRILLGAGNFADLMVERIEQGTPPAVPPPHNPMWAY